MERIGMAMVLAVGMATAAAAQQSREPARTPPGSDRTEQVSFDQADRNKDGRINREEGNQIAGFDFSRADTDGDASLTRQEFAAAMAQSTPRQPGPAAGDRTEQVAFEDADRNGDGRIDRDEAEDIDGFNFSAADVDDNRSVSREEYQAAMRTSRPRG